MTDWTKQGQELMQSWTKAQRQFWDTWKAAMPKAGTVPDAQTWGKMADLGKEAVEQAMYTQVEWANLWADSIRAQESIPKELKAWTDQTVSTMKTWNESQVKLWESILDATQQYTPEQVMQRMDAGTQLAFQTWQDAVRKAVEAQTELARRWTSEAGSKKA
jgi:hypothetical protein